MVDQSTNKTKLKFIFYMRQYKQENKSQIFATGKQVKTSQDKSNQVKSNASLFQSKEVIVQELCESRGGRPGLSVLTSLMVSVDVKLY